MELFKQSRREEGRGRRFYFFYLTPTIIIEPYSEESLQTPWQSCFAACMGICVITNRRGSLQVIPSKGNPLSFHEAPIYHTCPLEQNRTFFIARIV